MTQIKVYLFKKITKKIAMKITDILQYHTTLPTYSFTHVTCMYSNDKYLSIQ